MVQSACRCKFQIGMQRNRSASRCQLHHGQVDGVNAVRSPGSSLKPLIYAMAFDKGLATPMTVINDVPVNYMGYNPENYNSKFNGN